MQRKATTLALLLILISLGSWLDAHDNPWWKSSRVPSADYQGGGADRGDALHFHSADVLRELDLKPGDVVVDIGAGQGEWARHMAKKVKASGIVYAAEVKQSLVNNLKKKFADIKQIKPYLCEYQSVKLPENSCDLAFFSDVYHHLNYSKRIEYIKGLKKVVKPLGRLCVIEKYIGLANSTDRWPDHGTWLSRLVKESEQAGWVLVRYQLFPRSTQYMAIFVQRELFPVVGVAFYKPEQWKDLRTISSDKKRIAIDYKEWLSTTIKREKFLTNQRIPFKRVEVDLPKLVKWCKTRNYPINARTRSAFIGWILKQNK